MLAGLWAQQILPEDSGSVNSVLVWHCPAIKPVNNGTYDYNLYHATLNSQVLALSQSSYNFTHAIALFLTTGHCGYAAKASKMKL